MKRDIDIPGYPLPIDPKSGMGWWRFNLALCAALPNWSEWQKTRRIDDIIPILRWLTHGAVA